MTHSLRVLGRSCALHPWRTLISWLLIIGTATALSGFAGGSFRDAMTAPGSSSDVAAGLLQRHDPAAARVTARVVLRWDSRPADQAVVDRLTDEIRLQTDVLEVASTAAVDGRTVLLNVTYDVALIDLDAPAAVGALTGAVAGIGGNGVVAAVGGEVPESLQGPNGVAEGIGVAVALLVLLLALGSALAAGLPLLLAGAGLGLGLALIGGLSACVDISTVSPTLGGMLGLGVGIDYALFVIVAHRRHLAAGLAPVEAAAEATATAGRTVVSAGACVLIGITGLAFCGVPGFAWMGVAAALVVAATALAAVTLLPALLGLSGWRVFGRGARRAGTFVDTFRSPTAERVTRVVVAHPVVSLLIGVAALLALATPALQIRLGQNDAGSESADSSTRIAYDLVSSGFGPGANGPVLVVADAAIGPAAAAAISTLSGVASLSEPTISPDGVIAVRVLIPEFGPQDERTSVLIEALHTALPASAFITGPTAATADLTATLGARLWLVIAVVLAATFLLLVVTFGSILVPLKAVFGNLLSIAACYGVLTLAFQTRVGAAVLGLDGPVPIAAWAPPVLFAILFGLSMDYEIFLMHSIVEQRERHPDTREQIVAGMGESARLVVSAAAIMFAVALGFAFDPGVMVKIIGIGMASAILVDVTLVRLLIVPAAMALLGGANWWLPRGLLVLRRSAGATEHIAAGPSEPAGRRVSAGSVVGGDR